MAIDSQSDAFDRQDGESEGRLVRFVTWLGIIAAAIGFWASVGIALLGALRSH
jgi:hypothetical protein